MAADLAINEVDSYDSDESESSDNESSSSQRRSSSRGPAKNWVLTEEFENKDDAADYIAADSCWSISSRKNTLDGMKVYYRCNKVKIKGKQCPAAVYLLYQSTSEMVLAYVSGQQHDHVQAEQQAHSGLPEDIRSVVSKLYDEGTQKPNAILKILRQRQLEVPPKIQLKNFLQYYAKRKFGPAQMNLQELSQWCDEHPLDEASSADAISVLAYDFDADLDHQIVRFFASTKRLLEMSGSAEGLHADSTYKLMYNGFPVIIVGFTDKNRTFHPSGIAVCTGETAQDFQFVFEALKSGVEETRGRVFQPTYLLADASDAITNGFSAAFGSNFKRGMCWAHVVKCVDKKLDKVKDAQLRSQIRADIWVLQLCQTEPIFAKAAELFFAKWNVMVSAEIQDFLSYFRSEWILKKSNWFEGYLPSCAVNNNSLEATNNVLKAEGTYRERLPLRRFLKVIEDILSRWSIERSPGDVNAKRVALTPSKSVKQWTAAYNWSREPHKLLSINLSMDGIEQAFYATADKSSVVLSNDVVNRYVDSFRKLDWPTFDDFKSVRMNIWEIKMDRRNWNQAACSCPVFMKEFLCKHSLGVPIRVKLCDAPAVAKQVPIGQKRRRGRPQKAKKALVVQ